MIYYIHENEFITTDVELTENVGGPSLADYKSGKYVPLNPSQIEYMEANPDASPLEVFLMSRLGPQLSQMEDAMYQWYYANADKVIINNIEYQLFDWRQALQDAEVYKLAGRETMTFTVFGHRFRGNTQDVYNFLLDYAVFCCDLNRAHEIHYNYMQQHPDETDYDYTTGVPQVLSVNFEEIT